MGVVLSGSSNYANCEPYDTTTKRTNVSSPVCSLIAIQVSFYTPSSFPLIPIVTTRSLKLCQDSWNIIIADTLNELGSSVSGFTVFYNDFYDRLNVIDTTKAFDKILSKHCYGRNKIATKGSIIIRIVKYILSLDFESKSTITKLGHLGKAHSTYGIRPWMYSLFVETLLLTIASRLGYHARAEVMEAWVNIFAFTFKHMLPTAIKGLVNEDELHVRVCPHAEDISLLQANTAAVSKPQRTRLRTRTSSISPTDEVENKDTNNISIQQSMNKDSFLSVSASISDENLNTSHSVVSLNDSKPESPGITIDSKQSFLSNKDMIHASLEASSSKSDGSQEEDNNEVKSNISKNEDQFQNVVGNRRRTGSYSSIVGAENSPRGQGGRDYIASSEHDSEDGTSFLNFDLSSHSKRNKVSLVSNNNNYSNQRKSKIHLSNNNNKIIRFNNQTYKLDK